MTTLLWNADARIREVGTLRIKHIKFDERGANLRKILHYGSIRMKINRLTKKDNITKREHPHLSRHSRCTYIANYLTEEQMNICFGWVQRS